MQRFVYMPRVEAYIKLEEQDKVIDVSDDIISGSINLRLNAMSEAELTLQNKHGRYASGKTFGKNQITPMDRIIIRMSRVGEPENVFAGYIDAAPHYQMYSGPVTIRASCILKLLQHTYFDPGLKSVTALFQSLGWVGQAETGEYFNKGQWDTLDTTGTIKELIEGVLIEIGGWDKNYIRINSLPEGLIEQLGKLLMTEIDTINEDYRTLVEDLKKLYYVDVETTGVGTTPGANPVSGKVDPIKIAKMILDEGASQELATALMAIIGRESNFISDNINYNGGGDGSSEDGSYDFGLFQFNTVHAPDTASSTGSIGTPSDIIEMFYDPEGQWDEGRWSEDPIGNHSDHVHVSFGSRDAAVTIIDYARSIGLHVSENWYAEHSAPEPGVHVNDSYHYKSFPGKVNGWEVGMAVDASSTDSSKMLQLWNWVKVSYFGSIGKTGDGKGLSGPSSGASLSELKTWVKKQPQWVQDFYALMSTPSIAVAKAVRFGKQDSQLTAWVPGGKKGIEAGNTWRTGISDEDVRVAANRVAEAMNLSNSQKSDDPKTAGKSQTSTKDDDDSTKKTKDDAKKTMTFTFTTAHDTDKLPGYGAFDFMATALEKQKPAGQLVKVFAVEDGTIDSDAIGAQGGEAFFFTGVSGQRYWYGHLKDKASPGKYKAGDVIGTLLPSGNYPDIKGHVIHLHLGVQGAADIGAKVTVPHPPMEGLKSNSGELPNVGSFLGGTTSDGTGDGTLTAATAADIAAQVFYKFQMAGGGVDTFTSTHLGGERALANDISLMEWMSQIITGCGRVFTSDPNGNFNAFFPDYFGYYGGSKGGQTPVYYIADIEILDLTIQQNDTDLTTHVFTTGPLASGPTGQLSYYDRAKSLVASVEKPAFDWFLTVDEKENFDPMDFLGRYGARPFINDLPYITKVELLWLGSWLKFLELWSKRFSTNASFTFLPEIRPGYLINIGNKVQMFVESVNHTWNYTSGFKTQAQLSSAASLTDDITWLPRAGSESGLDDFLDEATQPPYPDGAEE